MTNTNITNTNITKIHDLSELKASPEATKSPYAIYEGERLTRTQIDRYSGILLSALDKEICAALASRLVLSSELLARHLGAEKKSVQNALRRLTHAGYVAQLGFESDTGRSAFRAYTLAGRGYSLCHGLGVSSKRYLGGADHAAIKKLLSSNQLLLAAHAEKVNVGGVLFIKPHNEQERARVIARPSAMILSDDGKVSCLVEAVRRTPDADAALEDKLTRLFNICRSRRETNIPISPAAPVILIAEDKAHMASLMAATAPFAKKMKLLYSFDGATYNGENFLYEYDQKKSGLLSSMFSALASCF